MTDTRARTRDAIITALMRCDREGESRISSKTDAVLAALEAAGLVVVEAEDRDVAMRFVAAHVNVIAGENIYGADREWNEGLETMRPAYEQETAMLTDVLPAYQRWQAEQARGEEAGR